MFEKIKKIITKKNKRGMADWLYKHNVEYIFESVDWYVVGHEADKYELDIWVEGWFIQAFYNDAGELTHYEIEEDD